MLAVRKRWPNYMPDLKATYPYIKYGMNKLNDNSRKWPLLIFSPMKNIGHRVWAATEYPTDGEPNRQKCANRKREYETKIAFIMMNLPK